MTTTKKTIGARAAKWIFRLRYAIFVFWLLMLVLGAAYGSAYLNNTVTEYTAPSDSDAQKATDAMDKYFGSSHEDDKTVVLIDTEAGDVSVINDEVQAFCESLGAALEGYSLVDSFAGYYTLAALPLLADEFVAANDTATFISVATKDASTPDTNDYIDWLQDRVDQYSPGSPYRIRLTGQAVFAKDIVAGVEDDMANMDSIVLPLALCILATILRNARLMILPVITLMGALGGSFAIMYPISDSMSVISFAPSMQMSTSLAIGIDQNLFLLSRFRDEIGAGVPIKQAVASMLQHAGHTVLVSGTTLMVCFFVLLFFPMELLQTVGVATALSIAFTIAVNMTLIPAVLMTFPNFFTDFEYGGLGCFVRPFKKADKLQRYRASLDDATTATDSESPFNLVLASYDDDGMSDSLWYKLGRFVTQPRVAIGVIVFVLAICLPTAIYCFDIKRGDSLTLLTPRGVSSTEAFADMTTEFGAGSLFPYELLIVGDDVLSADYFDVCHDVVQALVDDVDYTAADMFLGLCWLNSAPVPLSDVVTALESNATDSYTLTLQTLAASTIDPSGTATYLDVTLGIDPYGQDGVSWLDDARDVVGDVVAAHSGYSMYLVDGASVDIDAVDAVYAAFPTLVGVTLAIVFVLVGLAFKSVVAATRSVFSLIITLSVVYGLTSRVYQAGWLDFLGAEALSSVGEVSWFCPVMVFSIAVGLATDYDVFLFSRATETRAMGKNDRDAMVEALYHTGSIISCAGLIMSVAFSGLLLSSEMLLNQMSFMLVSTVMLDTFIVRPLFVPAVCALIAPYNWWPRKFPDHGPIDDYGYDPLGTPSRASTSSRIQ